MRFATIGTGWITDAFIEGTEQVEGMELAAVYSRDEIRGQAFSKKHGGKPVFTALNKLAVSDLIDAVYIASPNALHYEQSRLFLENGKHVLCEKPITVTPEQYRELLELALQNHLVYMEAIMMRHLPARALLHDALNRIGKITTARFDFSQLSSKYAAIQAGELPNIFNPAMAAGCFMDLGIYCVYAAVDLFGKPDRITASAGFLKTGSDGFGTAIFDYNDKQVILTYSKTGQSMIGSEILGDRGTLKIGSVSKLTDITLVTHNDGYPQSETIVGDIPKPVLMSGEAAAFRRFAEDMANHAAEYQSVCKLTLAVNETMEEVRRLAGIKFN